MKIVYSVLLMMLSLLIGFQQAMIVVHFKLNRDAIEQRFCINKNNPELQCHGTCHLKKQLRETENSASSIIRTHLKIDIFPASFTALELKNPIMDIQGKTSIHKEPLYTPPYREIFVPPPIG
ncbi:MAG: hypothetical protein KF746_19350 [Chitinophagaceae bacterium]|nr:hypothetical protein [Chitinophagaceae bacterium]